MSKLRTLGEIVAYMDASAPTASGAASNAPSAPKVDLHALMLEVVSEKTGYPVEMLGLEMDLEADLGVDSIKRVEILSAMREREPGLPEVGRGRDVEAADAGGDRGVYGCERAHGLRRRVERTFRAEGRPARADARGRLREDGIPGGDAGARDGSGGGPWGRFDQEGRDPERDARAGARAARGGRG